MAGIATVDTKLSYKVGAGSFTELLGLQEVGEIGGDPEKIDVTTLADKTKKYINGVKDLGDLGFKFIYDNSTTTSNYRVLKGFSDNNTLVTFQLEYPDGTTHTFDAYISVKMDSAAVNAALTFSCGLSLQSEITTANPA